MNYFFNMHWHSLQAFVDKPVSGHPNPHVEKILCHHTYFHTIHHYLIEFLVVQLPLQDWEAFNKAISRGLQIVHPDSIEFCPIDKSLRTPPEHLRVFSKATLSENIAFWLHWKLLDWELQGSNSQRMGEYISEASLETTVWKPLDQFSIEDDLIELQWQRSQKLGECLVRQIQNSV